MDGGGTARIIVGLGNPDRKYKFTRHNVGFWVIDELVRRWGLGGGRKRFHSRIWAAPRDGQTVILAQPQTYMNRSGLAAAELAGFYRPDPSAVLVVLDDMALPPGRLRARADGSSGGHRGLADVIAALGSERVSRLRIGIGSPPPRMDAADFVLSRFAQSERELMAQAVARAADAAADWLRLDIAGVMGRYNRDPSKEGGKEL